MRSAHRAAIALMVAAAAILARSVSASAFARLPTADCDMQGEAFDYVIVGTGVASGPLIRRLVDAGKKVAVLEQGPFFAFKNTTVKDAKAKPLKNATIAPLFDDTFQVYESAPSYKIANATTTFSQGHAVVDATQLSAKALKKAYPYLQVRGFGGNTLTYGGIAMRPSDASFFWWPNITANEMDVWFDKTINGKQAWQCTNSTPSATRTSPWCNTANWEKGDVGFVPLHLEVESSFGALGQAVGDWCEAAATKYHWTATGKPVDGKYPDYNVGTVRRFCGPVQLWQSERYRGMLQTTYVTPEWADAQRQQGRLKICVNARVTRLVLHEGTVTEAVVAGTPFSMRVRGSRFILTTGFRYTPQLLTASGIGDPADMALLGVTPTIALPDVGRHPHDEWAYSLTYRVTGVSQARLAELFGSNNRDQLQLAKLASGAWGTDFADVQLYFRTGNKNSLDEYLFPELPIGVTSSVEKGIGYLAIRVAMFQRDTFGNASRVFSGGSSLGVPDHFTNVFKMFANDSLVERYMTGALEGYKAATAAVASLESRLNITLQPITTTQWTIDAFNTKNLTTIAVALRDNGNVLALHGGGTAGIGRVVDAELHRVYNTTNLHVCDMSVFPFPVDANPTATIFALGERLAHNLLQSKAPAFSWSNVAPSPPDLNNLKELFKYRKREMVATLFLGVILGVFLVGMLLLVRCCCSSTDDDDGRLIN